MKGWIVFHTRRVPVLPTLYNPSWHPTAPFRSNFSVFAPTPCRGLILARQFNWRFRIRHGKLAKLGLGDKQTAARNQLKLNKPMRTLLCLIVAVLITSLTCRAGSAD